MLCYNVCMKIYKNGLSKELCEELALFGYSYFIGNDTLSSYGFPNKVVTKTNHSWNSNIVHESAPVIVYYTPDELTNKIRKEFQDLGMLSGNEYDVGSMVYIWTEGSYIPAHTDKQEGNPNRVVCTTYLNPEWNVSQGGTFHYQNHGSEEWHTLIPELGTIAFNDNLSVHYTTPVIGKTLRITLQFFATDDNKIN